MQNTTNYKYVTFFSMKILSITHLQIVIIQTYELQKVVGLTIFKKKIFYKIKWIEWLEEYNEWMTNKNMTKTQKLIQKYNENARSKRKRTKIWLLNQKFKKTFKIHYNTKKIDVSKIQQLFISSHCFFRFIFRIQFRFSSFHFQS